ncbi:tetraacyldisaccharide 4'-kinase [Arvimicrobium flavum]|uniref:tetraacyldisaccharide 4'-kinase n=1 Tax=Arvimicrobium flavum TaxID=3393320 RepID=UPI00237C48C5|nr:tetraacyldisaccharide 4'-kinase [Mesorhizobium shangrilense]
MASATPSWWTKPDWRAAALSPVAALYGFVAGRRMRGAKRQPVDLPVLCIGNFTVGGSGKTPTAIVFAETAKRLGLSPGILSRGHGGSFSKPHIVDPRRDSARLVGDEPLLLARAAPVAVTADRVSGARLLAGRGCDFLIMDDGFQSAHLHMDYALLVIDARYGLGNGRIFPAGPLRADLVDQMRFATALLVMGQGDAADETIRAAARAGRPVFRAGVRPVGNLVGRRYLAFAGIGHPEKFFDTVAAAGGEVVLTRSFADHHVYGDDELRVLARVAEKEGLRIVTTAKDAVRIGAERLGAMQPVPVDVLEIEAVFDVEDTPKRVIEAAVTAARQRKSKG